MRSPKLHRFALTALALAGFVLAMPATSWAAGDIPRTASGKPDFSGTYDAATLTPLERPPAYGDKLYMTPEEAKKIAEDQAAFLDNALQESDPNRGAPAEGGAPVVGFEDNPAAGEAFGAGNVGGYNWFWVDPGTDAFSIDGKFRTSILTDPKNGRMPSMTPEAQAEFNKLLAGFLRGNDGTAWWLGQGDGSGPYDNMEQRPTAERCLLGFTGQAPTLPSLYNNYKRIVQTDDHIVLVLEMVHDARIVRMNSEHLPAHETKWLGDSIGWWDGDTLVIETTNFDPRSAGFQGGSPNTVVTERLTRKEDGNVVYNFTVEDDTVWTAPWSGEYIWKATDNKMFEYACHEGNYALGNVMRGARLLEADIEKAN
jgi:hypothetical protein